ncbi:MAG: hypothetical protein F6K18_33655, partial [Okeania sp. SIO2C2]|uniref:Uma2 family endonuclease n=1 Tax=Okeania sp. SIO2C2 TaxID=2607787 RepID=UPI0013B663E9
MTNLTKWTVEDYHRMIDAGIIKNRQVELINGEIINMIPEEPIHRFINHRAVKYLRYILGNLAEVMEAHPVTLVDSEPEPDITIVHSPDTLDLSRNKTLKLNGKFYLSIIKLCCHQVEIPESSRCEHEAIVA